MLHKHELWHETWDKTTQHVTQGCQDSRQPLNIYIYIYISFNSHTRPSFSPLSKAKSTQCTNDKPESWNATKPQRAPKAKLPQFNSVPLLFQSFSCASGLCSSSHIPHFFSFTQSSQSLHLCPSPLLCFLTSLNSLFLTTHRPHSLE